MQKKVFLLLLILHSLLCTLYAQSKTDSLLQVIATTKDDTQKISALRSLTDFYSTKDFDKAVAFANQGIALSTAKKDLSAAGTFTSLKGLSFYFKGNYDSAAIFYAEALQLMATAKDNKGRASVLNYTGRLYRKLKDYDKSLAMYDEAFSIYQSLNDEDGMATIYNESGVVFEYKGDFEEAISRYKNSLQIREKMNDQLGRSYSLSFIGAIYAQQKKYAEAEKYLNDALLIRKSLNDPFALALSVTDLADMYLAMKDFPRAVAYYDSSNEMATRLKYPQLLSENYLKLSRLYESKNDAVQSLNYYKKHAALKDSLMSVEKVAQVEELNTKYETGKKEQQLALQQAALQKKNYLLAGSCILFLLLLIAGVNIYRKNQARAKLQLQQEVMKQQDMATKAILEAEENERKRIAADLHDGVGQLMSAARMNLSVFEHDLPFVNEEQRLSFENVLTLVDDSCREIRNVSHQMMPNALLKSGLGNAVKDFLAKIDTRIIKVTLHTEGLNDPIDKSTETVLYRVIQECVNNVLKHSGANHLDISLIKDKDGIAVTVEDNGRGFDTSNTDGSDGSGLKNIVSRISYLKGTVDFDSAPGKGTLIAIHVPFS
ncbi:sensor histidine kinase [Ferruginibacter sp. HRS2-29]|uniref:tetratricopeptide repeat-containing sensor histidine kinase n=1 Tax=Ferruginibacter sp. HRS2-29 TaxID=2487334 RepID=UPI0020CFA6DF|nr:sensor histidine kinase [Ferruginibacter sp. HRS2-29]MCP9750802.1 hypothetical protein [Ferruginibacter sp. HRS2-29]